MLLLTGSYLQEFRRPELVRRTARRGWGKVLKRPMRHLLVEALDDHGAAGRFLQFGEPHHHAKANEQHEHEDGARREARERADDELLQFGGAHEPSTRFGLTGGTSYITSPRFTSSIANRSAFFGSGPSSDMMRRRAPRRSCFARSAATSTNKN